MNIVTIPILIFALTHLAGVPLAFFANPGSDLMLLSAGLIVIGELAVFPAFIGLVIGVGARFSEGTQSRK